MAFPSKAHLEMMVRIELDNHLDAIAEADDQTLRVYKLITWAETHRQRACADRGAAAQNEGNPLRGQAGCLTAAVGCWRLAALRRSRR